MVLVSNGSWIANLAIVGVLLVIIVMLGRSLWLMSKRDDGPDDRR